MAGERTLEGVGLTMFAECYRGRRVLVTGHTGFKGSWLALWLTRLGAQVSGMSLAPATRPNHWDLLALELPESRIDIRDTGLVRDAIARLQPEIVFHLAAQSLVRASYTDPLGTWATNVLGTANVLDACRPIRSVRAVVVVTSDKCYENHETQAAYRESDPLGGHDPYSASKAGAELVTASYRRSFFSQPDSALVATARAGNVIGGGDWSQDRLIPDLVRAMDDGTALDIRSPGAVRPWQHVLDSLSGYLLLGQRLLQREAGLAGAWNFGPPAQEACTVEALLGALREHWPQVAWQESKGAQPHEAKLLQLDSTRARARLGWQPVWPLGSALLATADWYRSYLANRSLASRAQLEKYCEDAAVMGLPWAAP